MNIENYIESQYRELLSCSQINAEYSDLYKSFRNQKLREILMTLHHDLVGLFRTMNDPALVVEGFNTYGIVHETYALTRVIYFVMTGKTNTEKITNQNLRAFVEKGLNPDKIKRFQNIRDMISAFKAI